MAYETFDSTLTNPPFLNKYNYIISLNEKDPMRGSVNVKMGLLLEA
jgi:hypothetical protein